MPAAAAATAAAAARLADGPRCVCATHLAGSKCKHNARVLAGQIQIQLRKYLRIANVGLCVCVYLCVRSEIVFMCAKVEQFLNKAIRKINQTHMENYSVIAAVSVSVLVSVAWRINHQQLAAAAAAVAPTAAAAANEKRHKSISDFHSRETR